MLVTEPSPRLPQIVARGRGRRRGRRAVAGEPGQGHGLQPRLRGPGRGPEGARAADRQRQLGDARSAWARGASTCRKSPLPVGRGAPSHRGAVLVGKSVHSVEARDRAAQQGADYLIAGTIFASPSHPDIAPAGAGLPARGLRGGLHPRARHRRGDAGECRGVPGGGRGGRGRAVAASCGPPTRRRRRRRIGRRWMRPGNAGGTSE